jgi:cyclic-di-GMP phosphodiesterase TipF (flagellum assembly factor)
MRKITVPLLAAAYLCLALTVAVLLWRSGGGWGAGLAGLIGALGLAFALHGLIARSLDHAALSAEIGAVREANLILVRQIEQMQTAIQGLGASVSEDSARRSEELTTEVRMLEDLIQRMSDTIEERLASRPVEIASVVRSDDFYDRRERPDRHERQNAALLQAVRAALADNRVDLYLQPVVSLPQRRTMFYESFSRLRDEAGRTIMPAEYLSVAEPVGLVSAIDNLLLFRCVQIVRRLAKQDRKVGIFCNISLASLADETFFPQFIDFLGQNRDTAGGLIFELGQAAFEARGAVEARNMAKLADMGFRFSLDKVTDLALDFTDLSRADVKFVKIAGEVLLEQLLETDGRLALKSMRDIEAADFTALSRRYGVEVIAEKIEGERQVVDILELDVAFGQGNLFGEPRAIREAILAESDPPADFIRSTLARKAANW